MKVGNRYGTFTGNAPAMAPPSPAYFGKNTDSASRQVFHHSQWTVLWVPRSSASASVAATNSCCMSSARDAGVSVLVAAGRQREVVLPGNVAHVVIPLEHVGREARQVR